MANQIKIQIPEEYKPLYQDGYRYIVYYGGRYSLKSYNVALSQLIRGRQKKLRFLDTREVQNSIKDSVHKLLADQIEEYGFNDYEVLKDTIRNKVTGTEFIFKGIKHNITEIKSMQGIDEAWLEEAHGATKESLDILFPTIRKAGSRIVVTFNRQTELDPVYVKLVANPPANSYVKQLNYDIAIKYGLMTDEIMQEIEHDRLNAPDLYAHKWLGEPVSQTDKAIISRSSVVEAMQRHIEATGAIEIGVDVARMGNDRTVFKKRKGLKEIDCVILNKLKTTEVCDRLEQFADFDKEVLIKVDDTGVGGGVTDEMEKRGYNIMPINFGGRASEPDKYPNIISEAWFYIQSIMSQIELTYDPDLLMELSTREWASDNKGRRVVEGKESYKKKGYKSPDLADATILCFYSGVVISEDDIAL